ncbi:MAG: class II aldolase/adducin family protein, partial [Bryobacteraceae bacterium]
NPFTGRPAVVLAVKGSGGDLGSIRNEGFALLYMERLNQLKSVYRGEEHEDEMVAYYPSSSFANNTVPASIDTPLHAFLPFAHIDHLHPDWAIAIAASANGRQKLEEFNQRFGHRIAWLPWQRPGFELGLMLERAVAETPGCDGILLGSHGLFTWGETHRECYLNSLQVIDEMGQFVLEHQDELGDRIFGGELHPQREDAQKVAEAIFPYLRGKVATTRRSIAHYDASEDVLRFANSANAPALAALGTSCPDHFIRTRIAPLYVDWNPAGSIEDLRGRVDAGLQQYCKKYSSYYEANADSESPKLRDANPSVVLVPVWACLPSARTKKKRASPANFTPMRFV